MDQINKTCLKIGVVMDPIASINPKKDTSLALMLEAQARGHQVAYLEMKDLYILDDEAKGKLTWVKLFDSPSKWYEIQSQEETSLGDLDIILMRKDPPFDIEFIMSTYILELAEAQGVLVVNKAQSLRDVNEKVFTAWVYECCPPSVLTRSKERLKEFLKKHQKIVVKPTGKMGGQSIYVIVEGDINTNVILEEITRKETEYVQAQAYIPEIETKGDKRIILINGEPIPYGITRIPNKGDHRGNLAVGAKAEGFKLTDRDLWICRELGPILKEKGLIFVGIDVIGDYLTEINVTSPTGIREIDHFFSTNCAAEFYSCIEEIVSNSKTKLS